MSDVCRIRITWLIPCLTRPHPLSILCCPDALACGRRKMKIRSWSKEFLNVEKFGVPKDVKEAVSRAQVNGAYYLGK